MKVADQWYPVLLLEIYVFLSVPSETFGNILDCAKQHLPWPEEGVEFYIFLGIAVNMFLQVLTALCCLFPSFTLFSFIIAFTNILTCYLDQIFLDLKILSQGIYTYSHNFIVDICELLLQ